MAGKLTHYDDVAQAIRPAIERMSGNRSLASRVDQAIDESGGLKAAAIVHVPLVFLRSTKNNTNRSTTSTSVWEEYLKLQFTPPSPGSYWSAIVEAEFRGGVSDSTNIDAQLLLDGVIVDDITRSAPSSSAAPFFLSADIYGDDMLSGGEEHELLVRFKSDSGGNATVNNARSKVIAIRES